MTKILTLALALFVAVAPAAAPRRYRYYRSVSATSSLVTVKQASSNARPLRFNGAWGKSSGSCDASLVEGGSLSGGTAVSPVPKLDDRSDAASASVTIDGTLTGGTTVVSDPTATSVNWDGGMVFTASGSPKLFSVKWTCGGSQTLIWYVVFDEDLGPRGW